MNPQSPSSSSSSEAYISGEITWNEYQARQEALAVPLQSAAQYEEQPDGKITAVDPVDMLPTPATTTVGGDYPPLPEPLEINWPELNSQALGCGVEDRGLRDRYQCAEYGWEDGVDRAIERVPEEIYDAHQMRAYVDADRAARATPPSLPIDFKQASEQGGWLPLSTAPDGVRVLLGPREAPVVGIVRQMPEWADEREPVASVVHYNGTVLVAGYHCSEWHALPDASPSPHPEEGALLLGGDEGGKNGGA